MPSPSVWPDAAATSPQRLLLPRWLYRIIWFLVLSLALLNATFLIGLGYLYLPLIDQDNSFRFWNWILESYLTMDEVLFFTKNQNQIAMAYFIPAIPFIYVVLLMVIRSMGSRRLSFGAKKAMESGPRPSLIKNPRGVRVLLCPRNQLRASYRPFGIRGPYFEQNLLLKKTLEIILQTMQGYRMSQVISGRIVSLWFGVLIFINCWSDTIVQLLSRRYGNTLTERLFHILVDQLLDFLWGPVLQAVLIAPYVHYFHAWKQDPTVQNNPPKYGGAIQQDLRVIAVLSWTSYVWSILPSIVSAVVLLDLLVLLREAERRLWLATSVANNSDKTALGDPDKATTVQSSRLRTCTRLWRWLRKVHGVLFLILGCTSARYLFPSSNKHFVSCRDRVFAWFTHQEACFVRTVDCANGGITGRKHEMADIFNTIGTNALDSIGIFSCPELEMPAELVRFRGISSLQLSNVTLKEWDTDAPLSNANFPRLIHVVIRHSTMDCIPHGILKEPLPMATEFLYLEHTDISSFVHLVNASWSSVLYFYCVDCGLTRVPSVIKTMKQLNQLVLISNQIAEVVLEEIGGPENVLWLLALDFNPLTSLPDAIWLKFCNPTTSLFIQGTNITSIPDGLRDHMVQQCTEHGANEYALVYGYGSALCERPRPVEWPLLTCEPLLYE